MHTFIVNPNARTGLGAKAWNEIEPVLRQHHIPYEVFFTKYQRHATKLTAELTSKSTSQTIIALGGDGTVNEVINGIADFEHTTLGYIPIGSSNDFARGFGLCTEPLKALDIILHPKDHSYMNMGRLSYQNKHRLFAVSSGIGFDASICHYAVISKLKRFLNKIKLGKLTYAVIAINRLLYMEQGQMSLTLDDRNMLTFENVYFIAAMNHRYEGGGFQFCPKANPCDDLLNLIVIAGIPRWKALLLLPTAFWGAHIHFKGVFTYTCHSAKISSKLSLPVHTDGEPIFLQRDITVSLSHDKLRVITK